MTKTQELQTVASAAYALEVSCQEIDRLRDEVRQKKDAIAALSKANWEWQCKYEALNTVYQSLIASIEKVKVRE